jgi:hypothetical protein
LEVCGSRVRSQCAELVTEELYLHPCSLGVAYIDFLSNCLHRAVWDVQVPCSWLGHPLHTHIHEPPAEVSGIESNAGTHFASSKTGNNPLFSRGFIPLGQREPSSRNRAEYGRGSSYLQEEFPPVHPEKNQPITQHDSRAIYDRLKRQAYRSGY